MEFKVKDFVIYKNEGVCQIIKIETNDFGIGKMKYFVLKPYFVKSSRTIYIPIKNADSLRYPISKRKAQLTVKEISRCKINWINDNRKRKEYFQSLLEKGDLISYATIAKTVNTKKKEFLAKKKSMPLTDQNLAVNCDKLVKEELAIALGIDVSEIPEYIEKHSK